ncbi:unnamed protein product, partial [Mycena citricolor]
IDGTGYLRCGDACYDPFRYNCTDSALTSVPPHDCVEESGSAVFCTNAGCVSLVCCAGLFAVNDRCQAPCDADDSRCAVKDQK